MKGEPNKPNLLNNHERLLADASSILGAAAVTNLTNMCITRGEVEGGNTLNLLARLIENLQTPAPLANKPMSFLSRTFIHLPSDLTIADIDPTARSVASLIDAIGPSRYKRHNAIKAYPRITYFLSNLTYKAILQKEGSSASEASVSQWLDHKSRAIRESFDAYDAAEFLNTEVEGVRSGKDFSNRIPSSLKGKKDPIGLATPLVPILQQRRR